MNSLLDSGQDLVTATQVKSAVQEKKKLCTIFYSFFYKHSPGYELRT